MLQRGEYVSAPDGAAVVVAGDGAKLEIRSIHRREGDVDFLFCLSSTALQRDDKAAPFSRIYDTGRIAGPWTVAFDPRWGGPADIVFDAFVDWTKHPAEGIRYYSGTATYRIHATLPKISVERSIYLDLGEVKHIAEVTVNGANVGVVWTAPWRIDIIPALR